MKKYVLFILFCLILSLAACTQGEEDTKEFTGMISDGKVMGYQYTITKEENAFYWKVGYKEEHVVIQENNGNQDELQNYMEAINDSHVTMGTLIISVSFIIIVAALSFFLYKKNRKILKGGGAVIVVVAGVIALFIASDAAIELNSKLQDAKFHFQRLTQ